MNPSQAPHRAHHPLHPLVQHHHPFQHAHPFVLATHVSVPVTVAAAPQPPPQALPVLSAAVSAAATGATAAAAASSSSIYRPQKADIARLARLLLETPGPIDLSPFDALLLDTECLMELAYQMQNRAAAAVAAASLASAAAAAHNASNSNQGGRAPASATNSNPTSSAAASAVTASPIASRTTSAGISQTTAAAFNPDALAEARRLQVELEYSNGQLRTQLAKSETELQQARHWKRETEILQRKNDAIRKELLELQSQVEQVERFQRERENERKKKDAESSEAKADSTAAAMAALSSTTNHTTPGHTDGSHCSDNNDNNNGNLDAVQPAPSSQDPAPVADLRRRPTNASAQGLRRLQGVNRKLKLHLQEERAAHASRLAAERCKHERALRAYLRASVHALAALQQHDGDTGPPGQPKPRISATAAVGPATSTAPNTTAIQQSSSTLALAGDRAKAADRMSIYKGSPTSSPARRLKDPPPQRPPPQPLMEESPARTPCSEPNGLLDTASVQRMTEAATDEANPASSATMASATVPTARVTSPTGASVAALPRSPAPQGHVRTSQLTEVRGSHSSLLPFKPTANGSSQNGGVKLDAPR